MTKKKTAPFVPLLDFRDKVMKQNVPARPVTNFTTMDAIDLKKAQAELPTGRRMAFQVIKIVTLTPPSWDYLSNHLWEEYHFIKEANNAEPEYRPGYWSDLVDEGAPLDKNPLLWPEKMQYRFKMGVYLKVILVTDGTRRLLVDSQGYNYPRNVGLLPDHWPAYVETYDKPITGLMTTVQAFHVIKSAGLPPQDFRLKRECDEYAQGYNGLYWPVDQQTRHYKQGMNDRLLEENIRLVHKARQIEAEVKTQA